MRLIRFSNRGIKQTRTVTRKTTSQLVFELIERNSINTRNAVDIICELKRIIIIAFAHFPRVSLHGQHEQKCDKKKKWKVTIPDFLVRYNGKICEEELPTDDVRIKNEQEKLKQKSTVKYEQRMEQKNVSELTTLGRKMEKKWEIKTLESCGKIREMQKNTNSNLR